MPLDEHAVGWLEAVVASGAPALNDLDIATARQMFDQVVTQCAPSVDPVAVIEELNVPGPSADIPVRVYRPQGAGPLPAVIYAHGGGWVLGGPTTSDGICSQLATSAHAVLVSVDYRLAPEHAFPAAIEDFLAVIRWVIRNAAELDIDAERVAVAGDSAGAALAAVVTQTMLAEGDPIPPAAQFLMYPPFAPTCDSESFDSLGVGHFLTRDLMRWFYGHYLPEQSGEPDWRRAPLSADFHSATPATFVYLAEYDPLRDDGRAYVDALKSAGADVVLREYPGQLHGFIATLGGVLPAGQSALQDVGADVRAVFRAGWSPRLWLKVSI